MQLLLLKGRGGAHRATTPCSCTYCKDLLGQHQPCHCAACEIGNRLADGQCEPHAGRHRERARAPTVEIKVLPSRHPSSRWPLRLARTSVLTAWARACSFCPPAWGLFSLSSWHFPAARAVHWPG